MHTDIASDFWPCRDANGRRGKSKKKRQSHWPLNKPTLNHVVSTTKDIFGIHQFVSFAYHRQIETHILCGGLQKDYSVGAFPSQMIKLCSMKAFSRQNAEKHSTLPTVGLRANKRRRRRRWRCWPTKKKTQHGEPKAHRYTDYNLFWLFLCTHLFV